MPRKTGWPVIKLIKTELLFPRQFTDHTLKFNDGSKVPTKERQHGVVDQTF